MTVPALPHPANTVLKTANQFLLWKRETRVTLQQKGLWDFVTGEAKKPGNSSLYGTINNGATQSFSSDDSQGEPNVETIESLRNLKSALIGWNNQDQQAFQTIINSFCLTFMPLDIRASTSKDLWEILETYFQPKNFMFSFNFLKDLQSLRVDWCRDIGEYCTLFKSALESYNLACPLGAQLGNTIATMMFLSGLAICPAWESFAHSHAWVEENAVQPLECLMVLAINTQPNTQRLQVPKSASSGSTTRPKECPKWPPKFCNKCGKKGHSAEYCWADVNCNHCGRKGHIKARCWKRNQGGQHVSSMQNGQNGNE